MADNLYGKIPMFASTAWALLFVPLNTLTENDCVSLFLVRMHAYTFPSVHSIQTPTQKASVNNGTGNVARSRRSCGPIDWIYFEEFVPRAILLWLDFLHTYG